MRPWHKKLIVDSLKACIPFHAALRPVVRHFRPYTTNVSNDQGLLRDAVELAQLTDLRNKRVLEFGSGWNPVLPLVFRLAGADSVVLTDQERLLDRSLLIHAAREIQEIADIDESFWLRCDKSVLDVNMSLSLTEILEELNLTYVVPFQPASVESESIDVIVSRAVLEHVPEKLLKTIFGHFRRMLKADGIMLHKIDMSDHWEHNDKSISRVNFLQYSNLVWKCIGINVQSRQNRLRRCHYVDILREVGFNNITATGVPHAPSLKVLQTLKVAPRFAAVPLEELAIIETTITALE